MATDRTAELRAHDPRVLGEYELIGRLGEGGMGTVYLGRTAAGLLVAVKVVRADLAYDDEFRRRFRTEVASARRVPPFCTAEVLDADPDHEQPYLVVEYVDGPTLADVVEERGPLTAANLHSVAIGVATALTAIHGAGVIHRDLKPRNVLLAPGSPKVIDFGIARAAEATSGNTQPHQMLGTVAYMAPERFGAETLLPLSPAADVFAWGSVVAYAGLGRTPFAADSPAATAARILTQPPELDGLPSSLRDLVEHALEKDPVNRPTARELLDRLVAGTSSTAAAALAKQPDLRAAAEEAQAVTGVAPLFSGMVGYSEESIVTVPVPQLRLTGPPAPVSPRRWFLPVAVALVVLVAALGASLVVFLGRGPGKASAAQSNTPVAPLLIDDTLRAPRYWHASTQQSEQAVCDFENSELVAARQTAGLYKCSGPPDAIPDNFSAQVTVRLFGDQTCAGMWLRFRRFQGYLVRICSDEVLVSQQVNSDITDLRSFPLDEPVLAGDPGTRIGVVVRGTTLTVTRDGKQLGTATLPPEVSPSPGDASASPFPASSGHVVLGVVSVDGAPRQGPYSVAFSDIRIWGPPAR